MVTKFFKKTFYAFITYKHVLLCVFEMVWWIRLPSDNNDHLNLIPRKEKKQLLKVVGPPHTKWHVCACRHTHTYTHIKWHVCARRHTHTHKVACVCM